MAMRFVCAVLVAVIAVGCTLSSGGGRPEPPAATTTTTTVRPVTTVRRASTTTHVSDHPDFRRCSDLNDAVQVIVDDYEAGRVSADVGLSSIRIALGVMYSLDCGRFSPVIAREMANMDAELRSVGY